MTLDEPEVQISDLEDKAAENTQSKDQKNFFLMRKVSWTSETTANLITSISSGYGKVKRESKSFRIYLKK